jgi:hypothetical protein
MAGCRTREDGFSEFRPPAMLDKAVAGGRLMAVKLLLDALVVSKEKKRKKNGRMKKGSTITSTSSSDGDDGEEEDTSTSTAWKECKKQR